MINAFAAKPNLRSASRLPAISRAGDITVAELGLLVGCGALATLAVGLFHLQIRVPGHAILRAVLPMALGLALVPRRSAGMVMAIGAGLAAAALSWAQVGRFPPAALLSLLALGPVLDLALAGKASGWRLYARFAAAGMITNLLAFAARLLAAKLGWELAGSRQFITFWSGALVSFLLCGALAGAISVAFWFRLRTDQAQS